MRSAAPNTASTSAHSAPAARYASSANPAPSPAPCSTMTVCPRRVSSRAPAGVSATRRSSVLISAGTPTVMGDVLDVDGLGLRVRLTRLVCERVDLHHAVLPAL